MSDLTILAAHARERAADPTCPEPERALWESVATEVEEYLNPPDQDGLFDPGPP